MKIDERIIEKIDFKQIEAIILGIKNGDLESLQSIDSIRKMENHIDSCQQILFEMRLNFSDEISDMIIALCCQVFKITTIVLKTRKQEYVWARRVASVLIRRYSNYSLKHIGNILGGFHHSTVIHCIEMHELMKQSNDEEYMGLFNRVETMLSEKILWSINNEI